MPIYLPRSIFNAGSSVAQFIAKQFLTAIDLEYKKTRDSNMLLLSHGLHLERQEQFKGAMQAYKDVAKNHPLGVYHVGRLGDNASYIDVAVDMEVPAAQYYRAKQYASQRDSRCLKLMWQSARFKDPSSLLDMGSWLINGWGYQTDARNGLRAITYAAKNEHPIALRTLATFCLRGFESGNAIIERNFARALLLLRAAGKAGDKKSALLYAQLKRLLNKQQSADIDSKKLLIKTSVPQAFISPREILKQPESEYLLEDNVIQLKLKS